MANDHCLIIDGHSFPVLDSDVLSNSNCSTPKAEDVNNKIVNDVISCFPISAVFDEMLSVWHHGVAEDCSTQISKVEFYVEHDSASQVALNQISARRG